MALAVASKEIATTTSTTLTITKPTSLAAGDLMIACVVSLGATHVTRSGWEEVAYDDETRVGRSVGGSYLQGSMTCLARIADAGDAAASNFAFTTGGISIGYIYRITRTVNTTTWPTPLSSIITGLFRSDIDSGQYGPAGSITSVAFTGGVTPVQASSLMIMNIAYGRDVTNTAIANSYTLATDNPTWTEEYDNSVDFDSSGDVVWVFLASATAIRTQTTATGNYTVGFSEAPTSQNENKGFIGLLLSISEYIDASVTLDLASLTATPRDLSITGDANITLDAASMTATPQIIVATSAEPKWKNTDKSSAGAITNTPKS